MKAIDLVVKLNEAILKYGSDCDVCLLEGIHFGGDRYGIGVALVAGLDKHMEEYKNAKCYEDARDTIKDNLNVLETYYFDVEGPLW